MPDRPLASLGAREASSPRVDVACLAELRRALEDPSYAAVCFVGPSGQARSDLLYALADSLRTRCRLVFLRGTPLPTGGFWMRVAEALELASGYDARRRVLRLAGELSRTGQALLLVIEDAPALPADTLYALLATARSQPGLHVVVAHGEGEHLAGPLPEDVALVRGAEPASEAAASAEPVGAAEAAAPELPARSPLAPLVAELSPPPGAPSPEPPTAPETARDRAAARADLAAPPSGPASAPAAPPWREPAPETSPPWEEPLPGPARTRRRVARKRRHERTRRAAWGAAGLALGLLLAAALDTDQWQTFVVRALERVAGTAPTAPAPDARAPVAPSDVAAKPPVDPAKAPPEQRVPDVGAPPSTRELAVPPLGSALGGPGAAPPAPTDSATGAAPQLDAPGAPTRSPAAAPSPPPTAAVAPAGPAAPAAPVAPAAPAESAVAPPAPAGPSPTPRAAAPPVEPVPEPPSHPVDEGERAPDVAAPPPAAPAPDAGEAAAAPPPPQPLPRPTRRGPLALGALAIASESPVLIEIDGQPFGPTPLAGIRLSRGEHRVLAHFPDGSVAQKTIALDEQDLAIEFR